MRTAQSNGRFFVNGFVVPPIVLHSENETYVAQNAHNLVWERHREEYDKIETEIKTLTEAGKSPEEAHGRMNNLHTRAKSEIDALVVEEIAKLRSRYEGGCHLQKRIDELEETVSEMRNELEDIRSIAAEALDNAAEARNELEDIRSIAAEALDNAAEALERD